MQQWGLGNNLPNFEMAHTTKYRDIWLLEWILDVIPITPLQKWVSLSLQFFLSGVKSQRVEFVESVVNIIRGWL